MFIQNWLYRSCRVITSMVGQASYTQELENSRHLKPQFLPKQCIYVIMNYVGSECHLSCHRNSVACYIMQESENVLKIHTRNLRKKEHPLRVNILVWILNPKLNQFQGNYSLHILYYHHCKMVIIKANALHFSYSRFSRYISSFLKHINS